jgi:hypothetical protein
MANATSTHRSFAKPELAQADGLSFAVEVVPILFKVENRRSDRIALPIAVPKKPRYVSGGSSSISGGWRILG